MAEQLHADVVVVGAGPVGLTLAMDLAWRGVDVVVLESRAPGEPPSVKSNHVSARSMEIFRRLGVAQKVRNAGLPADYPNDVVYRTAFLGREITAHQNSVPRRTLHGQGRPGYLVADAGAAAPDQPDLSRTGIVSPPVGDAGRAHFQRHVAGRFYAECRRRHGLRHR